jgi:hypothetical protein
MPETFTDADFAQSQTNQFTDADFQDTLKKFSPKDLQMQVIPPDGFVPEAPTFQPPPGAIPPGMENMTAADAEAMVPAAIGAKGIGQGFATASKALLGGVSDLGKVFFRPITDELYPEQAVPGAIPDLTENISQFAEPGKLPAQDLRSLPTSLQVVGHGAQGLVESAPKLAGVAAMESVGVPAPLAAGMIFGTTEEGFDPVQGAFAAALPVLGRYSGEITAVLGKRLGISSVDALNIIKGLGATSGPAAASVAAEYKKIKDMHLPPEMEKQAFIDMWANVGAQAALGPMGVKRWEGAPTRPGFVRDPVSQREVPAYLDAKTGKWKPLFDMKRAITRPAAEKQVREGATTPMEGLSPEDQKVLDEERKAIDTPVETVDELPEGDPFAGQVATINRKAGKILINSKNFKAWLKDIPPENRAEAVKTLLSEERIHLATTDAQALRYWNSLTEAEKAIVRRRYTGTWSGKKTAGGARVEIDDVDFGHEALRSEMQKLARMNPREIAEAVKGERFTLKMITALESAIRFVRQTEATTASGRGQAILDRVQENLDEAKTVMGSQPGVLMKDHAFPPDKTPQEDADAIFKLPAQQFVQQTQGKGGPTGAGYDFAVRVGPEHKAMLEKYSDEAGRQVDELMGRIKSGQADMASIWPEMAATSARRQFFKEGAQLHDAYNDVMGGMDMKEALAKNGVQGAEKQLTDMMVNENQSAPGALFKKLPPHSNVKEKMLDEFSKATFQTDLLHRMMDQARASGNEARIKQLDDMLDSAVAREMGLIRAMGLEFTVKRGDKGEPGALFKGKKKQEGGYTPEMFLPPIEKGEERPSLFEPVTSKAVDQAAADYFTKASEKRHGKIEMREWKGTEPGEVASEETRPIRPSFEEFLNEMKGRFGSGIKHDQAYYAWTDNLGKWLMNAKGSEIEGLMDNLGLRSDVADALNIDRFGRGTVPDLVDLPQTQMQLTEIQKQFGQTKWRTPGAFKRFFSPKLQRRYAAIASIMDTLSQEAGAKPSKPWNRSEIGPEDIDVAFTVLQPSEIRRAEPEVAGQPEPTEPEISQERKFRVIPQEKNNDPTFISNLVKTGARASGEKVSRSKSLLALKQNSTGRIMLVNGWEDPRRGTVITNPGGEGPSARITPGLLDAYTPTHHMIIRQPVEDFRQVFKDEDVFAKWFGGAGIEGTPGLKTSSFVGPEAAVAREQAGVTPPSPKVGEEKLPPPPVEKESKTARELSTLRFGRKSVPAEPMPEKIGERPEPSKKLSKKEQAALTRRIKAEQPYTPTSEAPPSAELQARGIQISPFDRGFRPGEEERGLITGNKALQREARLKREAAKREQGPGALFKNAQESTAKTKDELKAVVTRASVKEELPAILDGVERAADLDTLQARSRIILASGEKGNTKRAAQIRGAARAMLATGQLGQGGTWAPQRNFLQPLINDANTGILRAQNWQRSINPIQRYWGRQWEKAAQRLKAEAEFARDNWNDPDLRRTVDEFREIMKEQIAYEQANGWTTKERENYVPGRYEAEFFNDKRVSFAPFSGTMRVLGEQFRGRKVFRNHYEAISKGPYIPASYDLADIAQSRISKGRYQIAKSDAFEVFKGMTDPESGEPIAVEPKKIPTGRQIIDAAGNVHQEFTDAPPSSEHELVDIGNGKKIAVREGFVKAVKALTLQSHFEHWPGGKEALLISGMLKHGGLLVGDLFHPSRLAQFATALSGKKFWEFGPGYKGGYTALAYREADLPEAVRKGYITQKQADWASEVINVNMGGGRTGQFTRAEIARELMKGGMNSMRLTDALYKDAVQRIPFVGERWHKIIGTYNNWLFNRFVPGLMTEAGVRNFERLNEKYPDRPVNQLVRDVARDMNVEFGSMGRQGVFKNPTFRDFAQVLMLAPGWREGLYQKEIRTLARVGRAGFELARGNPTAAKYQLETPLVRGMWRGLLGYFILTQAINLITKKQLTFKNEKGHKLDAWIPVGSKGDGLWISPLSVFAEIAHDTIRLMETRKRTWDAIMRLGENTLGPMGKLEQVMRTGRDPSGVEPTTTAGVLKSAGEQLAPIPISAGPIMRGVAHAVAPNMVSPIRPVELARAGLTYAGIKSEIGRTDLQKAQQNANDWKEKEGRAEHQMEMVPTDEASYSKLRAAIRNMDEASARHLLEQLRKHHKDDDIVKAMKMWSVRPLTGSKQNEEDYKLTMDEKDMEIYHRAMLKKAEEYNDFTDWFLRH